jgi:ATP-dependent DNA helicase RecG
MGTNEVDAALAAARDDVGRRLLSLTEDQWFERKGAAIAAKDLAATLVAFANAEGGVVVVGASNGRVQGLGSHRTKINDLRRTPIQMTVPAVRVRCEEIDCVNDGGLSDVLLVMRVDTSERVHELTNGDCYLRVGDSSHRLSYVQRQELEYDKGQAQYDGHTAAGITFDDLDAALVNNYRSRTGATQPVEALLGARSLLDRSGNLTNAAYLLFGQHPQDMFPQAYVRVLRFLTRERGTGARLGLDDDADIRVEGPIPLVIQRARNHIEELIPKRRALSSAQGTFEAVPIIPTEAWLEGVVNAVIHRSYSLGGDHIRVEIYPDRVEIESPGRFPGLADPTHPLQISRFARNPRIARVCADLRIGQELGEGIKRIFEEMQRVGLSDPIYHQTGGTVRLTLAAIPRLDPELAARLPRGSQAVLDTMRAAAVPLGTGDISELLALSRPATQLRLKALADAHLIRWNGKSPKDPRAVWELEDH